MKQTFKRILHFTVATSVLATSAYVYAGTCATPVVAKKINRTDSDCHKGIKGALPWQWGCYDESWKNGGCLAPNDKDFECKEAPMTNPISYSIYAPDTSSGSCVCTLDSTNTPTGQVKGVQQSTPCGATACTDPVDTTTNTAVPCEATSTLN